MPLSRFRPRGSGTHPTWPPLPGLCRRPHPPLDNSSTPARPSCPRSFCTTLRRCRGTSSAAGSGSTARAGAAGHPCRTPRHASGSAAPSTPRRASRLSQEAPLPSSGPATGHSSLARRLNCWPCHRHRSPFRGPESPKEPSSDLLSSPPEPTSSCPQSRLLFRHRRCSSRPNGSSPLRITSPPPGFQFSRAVCREHGLFYTVADRTHHGTGSVSESTFPSGKKLGGPGQAREALPK